MCSTIDFLSSRGLLNTSYTIAESQFVSFGLVIFMNIYSTFLSFLIYFTVLINWSLSQFKHTKHIRNAVARKKGPKATYKKACFVTTQSKNQGFTWLFSLLLTVAWNGCKMRFHYFLMDSSEWFLAVSLSDSPRQPAVAAVLVVRGGACGDGGSSGEQVAIPAREPSPKHRPEPAGRQHFYSSHRAA